jgi:mannose/cellobiose epimerase-like protein (N-acyl-D-glucosamine 2-epimerase family)
MQKFFLISFLSLLYSTYCVGQYVVKSENILNPDLNIDYVTKNLDFWIKNAYDPTYGGFFSKVDRDGTILNQNQKSLISQTRHGYGFTRAFMLTGDEMYLDYAKSALDFLYNHGWDTTNDGWYCFAKRDGSVDYNRIWNPNTYKWGFQQHYALVGIIANYEATHDANAKSWMDKGLASLNNHMWDARSGYEGYYETTNLDWSNKTGKGFTSTVDAITTNAELIYLITQNSFYKNRLMLLSDNIVNRFVPTMDDARVKVLYPETYNTNWVPDYSSTSSSIGHFLKTAWCLGRAYLCDTTKSIYKNAAIKILNESWNYQDGVNSIWDHVNGGPFNGLDFSTGAFTNGGDNKDYWTLEQGFTGPMINYYITKNPIYLQMADESLDFFMKHQVDSIYGEIFSELDPAGTTIRSGLKGDDYKACYHSTELGYYAYLYSNLYYLHQPASLYYKFVATTTNQDIKLTPIPMEEGLLRIKSVTLDGVDFTTFNPVTRTLNIAANQGGKFKVTYESLVSPTAVNSPETNYISVSPNPTKGSVKVAGIENINSISIVDFTGKILLERKIQNQSSLNLNIDQFNSGVYFVILHQNSGEMILKKIIKQ